MISQAAFVLVDGNRRAFYLVGARAPAYDMSPFNDDLAVLLEQNGGFATAQFYFLFAGKHQAFPIQPHFRRFIWVLYHTQNYKCGLWVGQEHGRHLSADVCLGERYGCLCGAGLITVVKNHKRATLFVKAMKMAEQNTASGWLPDRAAVKVNAIEQVLYLKLLRVILSWFQGLVFHVWLLEIFIKSQLFPFSKHGFCLLHYLPGTRTDVPLTEQLSPYWKGAQLGERAARQYWAHWLNSC